MQEDDIRVDISFLRLDREDPSIRTCENNAIETKHLKVTIMRPDYRLSPEPLNTEWEVTRRRKKRNIGTLVRKSNR